MLTQLTTRYSSCNSQIESIRAEYTKAQTVIQTNNNNIRTIENNAADAPRQIELATQQLRVVDSTISDLEARLNDARTQNQNFRVILLTTITLLEAQTIKLLPFDHKTAEFNLN